MRRPITVGDLCELTGYSRDQMRGLLAELPRFAARPGAARVARVYSNHDVLVVALLCRLEAVYGLKRGAVAALCEPIAETLATPRVVSKQARLILQVSVNKCEYQEETRSVEDGIVVPLEPVFSDIDSYLLPAQLIQREIGLSALGPAEAAQRMKLHARSGEATREKKRNG